MAAALSALQIGLFLLLVWIPIVAAGSKVPSQWTETILNAALLAGAWIIADSTEIRLGSPPITVNSGADAGLGCA